MLHRQFNHVGAGQADGVFRHVFAAAADVKGAHAQQRRVGGDLQQPALFGLRAARADARLAAGQRLLEVLFDKLVQRTAVELLQRRPPVKRVLACSG